MKPRDRHITMIAYVQYARFIRELRTVIAIMRAHPHIGELAVMTPLGEPRIVYPSTPVGDVLAQAMIEIEELRAELGAKPFTPKQMQSADSFDSAVWEGLEHLYEGDSHDRRYAH